MGGGGPPGAALNAGAPAPGTRARLAVAAGFAALSGVVWWQTTTDLVAKRAASGGPRFDAAFVPEILATILLALAGLQALSVLRGADRIPPPIEEAALGEAVREERHLDLRALGCAAALIALVMVLKWLGFYLSLAAFAFCVNALLFVRNPLVNLALSVAATLVAGYVFGRLLNVVLPAGVFEIAPF